VLAYDANGALVPMQPLAIEGGTVTVENDGNGALVVDDFHIELADVVAEHGANETHPRTLTNVSVSLGRPLTLTSPWSDDGTGAHANAHGDLRLDWAIVDEATGQPAPLTSDSWQNVEINVYLHAEDDGSVSAHIASTIEGRVLATWGIELSDFLMNVRATDS
jgi:hypothetical protein